MADAQDVQIKMKCPRCGGELHIFLWLGADCFRCNHERYVACQSLCFDKCPGKILHVSRDDGSQKLVIDLLEGDLDSDSPLEF